MTRDAAQLSAMLCPVCHVGLAMTDRQGVEIDYCPQCRGIWLDRAEPLITANTIRCHGTTASVTTSIASTMLCAKFKLYAYNSTVRRSKRSAKNPDIGDINTEGIMAANVTEPTQVAEVVICNTRAARATINAQADDWEKREANHNLRYS